MAGRGAAMPLYIVQPGDSLCKTAAKFQVEISELIWSNPQVKNNALIYPGQQLSIPRLDIVKYIEQKVIKLTNGFRQSHGLPVLTTNLQLSRVARLKAEDMLNKNYAGHISPFYGSPFNMLLSFGISYQTAAENIAGGQATPEEVINAWINHPTHRDNMLNSKVRQIGTGYAKGGCFGHYWVQMFID